ncbi:MAG: sulfatase/phosphatase domain-containing protein, partial [Bacteroidota bacterium]
IAAWPGKIQPGSETDHLSAFWDVMPTLLDVAQQAAPQEIDGLSFLPTLLGQEQAQEHAFLYWEFPAYGGQQAIRQGPWKAIRKSLIKGSPTISLYNLDHDIQEQNDLADSLPDKTAELLALMQGAHQEALLPKFRMKALGDSLP